MDLPLDPMIMAALPAGCEVVAINRHGTAGWSSGYKVDVEVDGEEKAYFLKVIDKPQHAAMARGEFEAQKEMSLYIPDNVVTPLAHGTLGLDSSKSFFLTTFRNLGDNLIDPSQLVDVLERLHSQSSSPTGKYGFHVPTFNGMVPILNEWCDTWEEYFARQLRSDFAWEQSVRGPDPRFEEIAEGFFQKVIPRLLRPLETGGRKIKPTLVHGDIWHGNVQIDVATQQVILFDSCCCYAHNELELHMMREPRYRFSNEHIDKYKEVMPPSEPTEDFDDRNALYAMRDNIINSGLHMHRSQLRQQVNDEMRRLLAKFPDGLSGFHELAKS